MTSAATVSPMASPSRPSLRSRLGADQQSRRFVNRLHRRDRGALDALYAEYAPTVLGYLINTLPDRGMAEDVHQQVFLEVWQRAAEYDPQRATLLTWIMTIARSRAIDQLRRRVPEPRDPLTEAGSAADPDPELSPDALVERWRVAHLLSRLRADEAAMLRMRFYEGLSQTQIADRVGVPLGTVKMRMVNALERLRDMIDEEEAVAT